MNRAGTVGLLVDKDNLINVQLVISYRLFIRILTNQPTVDKTIVLSVDASLSDKIWKLTNTVRVGLAHRSSHSQRLSTFPDNVCSYFPLSRTHGVSHSANLTLSCFS
jgi:hypothetical protein